MLTGNEIKDLKDKLDSEEVIYSWDTITPAIKEPDYQKRRLKRSLVPVIFTFFPFIILSAYYFDFSAVDYYGLIIILAGAISCFCLFYFFQFADYYYEFELTKIGIIKKSSRVYPEGTYTILRAFAWFGVAVCLVAFFIMGPLAFVGAGAFALMSFKMTSISPTQLVMKYVFAKKMIIINIQSTNSIELISNPIQLECSPDLYFSDNDRASVLSKLQEMLVDAEYIDALTSNDAGEHPSYRAAVAARKEMNPETADI